MACPTCGGLERRILAPGYFECLSLGSLVRQNPIHPALGTTTSVYVCGVRYQEATASMTMTPCACGIFAIGRCGSCERTVCGEHSSLSNDILECRNCTASRQAAAQQRQVEQEQIAAAAQHAEDDGLPLDAYLVRVARMQIAPSRRSANGSELACALQAVTSGFSATFDGKGSHVIHHSGYITRYIKMNGELVQEDRSRRFSKTSTLNAANHTYSPADVTSILTSSLLYHKSLQGTGSNYM